MTAEQIEMIKQLLPTALGSAEIRSSIASQILRQSVFSARMESARYLAQVQKVCAQVAGGGMNLAAARLELTRALRNMGHDTANAKGITDPASVRRLNLIIKTRSEMAANAARVNAQDESSVYAVPAWELLRFGQRRIPRDWAARWKAAGDAVGWAGASRDYGAMVALKSSPIWQALGDGAGGYKDTLGNPYPPFAFSSGMAWAGVERRECVKLGLISEDERPGVPRKVEVAPTADQISEAVQRTGINLAEGLQAS
jgi:hypothetical protein